MAFFDAGRVRGSNFATILAVFGAELHLRWGFATKMAFFGAEQGVVDATVASFCKLC